MQAFRAHHKSSWLWACLLAALLWAQSLGLVHRLVHAPGMASVSEASAFVDAPTKRAAHTDLKGFWSHFWGDAQTADCLSYDQLAQGQTLSQPIAVVALALPAWLPLPLLSDARRIHPALFEARGPPVWL